MAAYPAYLCTPSMDQDKMAGFFQAFHFPEQIEKDFLFGSCSAPDFDKGDCFIRFHLEFPVNSQARRFFQTEADIHILYRLP